MKTMRNAKPHKLVIFKNIFFPLTVWSLQSGGKKGLEFRYSKSVGTLNYGTVFGLFIKFFL